MITNGAASLTQSTTLDLEAINTHLSALTQTQSCPRCNTAITAVLSDVASLLAVAAQLYDELAGIRLHNANLRAAMQAALGAAADGEADPLDYLRWELAGHQAATPDDGRGRA